jgi:nucleoid DNA-binding protein
MNTTRADLVADVADSMGLRHTVIRDILDRLLEVMAERLTDARDGAEAHIQLRGFGTLGTQVRKSLPARNPKTGEKMQLPAVRRVYFKPAPKLRAKIKEVAHAHQP